MLRRCLPAGGARKKATRGRDSICSDVSRLLDCQIIPCSILTDTRYVIIEPPSTKTYQRFRTHGRLTTIRSGRGVLLTWLLPVSQRTLVAKSTTELLPQLSIYQCRKQPGFRDVCRVLHANSVKLTQRHHHRLAGECLETKGSAKQHYKDHRSSSRVPANLCSRPSRACLASQTFTDQTSSLLVLRLAHYHTVCPTALPPFTHRLLLQLYLGQSSKLLPQRFSRGELLLSLPLPFQPVFHVGVGLYARLYALHSRFLGLLDDDLQQEGAAKKGEFVAVEAK